MTPGKHQNDAPRLTDKKARHRDSIPERQCVVTRERRRQTEMVRFALSPDGIVTPDVAGKLPGRGVWVLADRETLDVAIKTKAFSRGFKTQATAPDGLVELTIQLLTKRCLDSLSLAKKAGAVVLGFDQVRADIQKRAPGWILEAADGSADGRGKVYSLAKALYENVKIAGALTSSELGMAFGREHVIHGVLVKGPFAKRFGVEYKRLTGFRTAPENSWFSGENE